MTIAAIIALILASEITIGTISTAALVETLAGLGVSITMKQATKVLKYFKRDKHAEPNRTH